MKMIPFESWQTTSSIKVCCAPIEALISPMFWKSPKKWESSAHGKAQNIYPHRPQNSMGSFKKKCPSQKSFPITARFWVSSRFRFPRMSSYISNTKRLAVEVFCSGLELARHIVDMKDVIVKESRFGNIHVYFI